MQQWDRRTSGESPCWVGAVHRWTCSLLLFTWAGVVLAGPLEPHIQKTRPLSLSENFEFVPDTRPRDDAQLRHHLRQYQTDSENPELLLNIGIDYLNLANTSRWHYLDQAIVYLEKANELLPKDPVIMMYLGRTIGAQALNEQPSLLKRLKWAKMGYKLMDQAVDLKPECYFLRLLRGEAEVLAHPILRRGTKMREDAAFVQRFLTQNEFEQLPDYVKGRVHLFLGDYFKKIRSAESKTVSHWNNAIRLAQNTPLSEEAKARVDGTYISLGFEGE